MVRNSSFSEYSLFGSAGGITIGDNVIAGQNVRFHAENHNYSDLNKLIVEQGVSRKGISVGHNCWIGAGAVFWMGPALVQVVLLERMLLSLSSFQIMLS